MDPKKKSKILVLATVIIPILIGLLAYYGSINSNQAQVQEIKDAIAKKGGTVTQLIVVNYEDSPFERSGKGNTIYKIIYEKEGKTLTAWYRALNQSSIIREEPAWIFE
ncbi:hypothetical protein [Brevibacillus migulae]|uniref:hypothetical protein n=1 Tax=Brevibacillus migulae TaxID=1644114 RepID=UPI00106EB792|nr:hypothetical protein [Brevibacillus migulae]